MLKTIQYEFPSLQSENAPYDILFATIPEAYSLLNDASEENKIYNNSLLLIDTTDRSSTDILHCEKIKNHHKVRISVDLFYCIAIFFRREQAKEHFKIRI